MIAPFVYLLCAFTSAVVTTLLYLNYRKTRVRLLFWSSLAFLGLALNNILLVIDVLIGPDYDLSVIRTIPAVLGMVVLIFGLIKETT